MAYTDPKYMAHIEKRQSNCRALPTSWTVRAQTDGGYDQTVEIMDNPTVRMRQILEAADNLGPNIDVTVTVTFNGANSTVFNNLNNNDGDLAQRIADWVDARYAQWRDGL